MAEGSRSEGIDRKPGVKGSLKNGNRQERVESLEASDVAPRRGLVYIVFPARILGKTCSIVFPSLEYRVLPARGRTSPLESPGEEDQGGHSKVVLARERWRPWAVPKRESGVHKGKRGCSRRQKGG